MTALLLSSTALSFGGAAQAQDQDPAPLPTPELQENIEEIVVRGAFVPDEKRATSEISAVLDAEQLEITGDSDIGAALRRVTGLSLVRGKFVYVRGLGERYSSATLNGSPLPSPEPLRRVVPLDIFPTSIVASSTVQKTFSPEYSAEFGGGLIDIRTKVAPDEQFFDFSFSVGANTETTFKDGLTYDGSEVDFLGFKGGTRQLPAPFQEALLRNERISSANFTDDELQLIGRSLENSKLWVIQEGTVPVDVNFNFTFGDSYDVGDGQLGFIASVGYRSDWQTKDGIQQTGQFGADAEGNTVLEVNEDFNFTSTQNDINWHGLFGVGYDYDAHSVQLTNLYIRKATKEARFRQGFDTSLTNEVRRDFLEFFVRELFTSQLAGEHDFENLQVSWRGAYAESSRDAPYERTVRYVLDDDIDAFIYDNQQGRNQTDFSFIQDEIWSGGVDLKYLAEFDNGMTVDVKAGYSYTDTQRNSQQRGFRFIERGDGLPADLLASRIDFIFADQNINPNRLVISENTGGAADPAYDGELTVHAPYVGFDAQLTPLLRAAVGLRYEDGSQFVDSFSFFTPNTEVETVIDEKDYLPAVTLTYEMLENVQFRVGFSQTIARPQFRELAPSQFIDQETDRNFSGNPFLTNSELDNYDARFEWYFGRGEFLTLGAFYKTLRDPIEETITSAGDSLRTTFQNVPKASLYGFEFEFEKRFEDVFESGWFAENDYVIRTNYTYSDSEIKVNEDDTVIRPSGQVLSATDVVRPGRNLQGQSDHILNVQIGYESQDGTSDASFFLNYVSKRIRAVAPQNLPEIIERVPTTLDFTYRHRFDVFNTPMEVKFNVKNILGDDYNATQEFNGAVVNVDTYDIGRSFSLGLSASF